MQIKLEIKIIQNVDFLILSKDVTQIKAPKNERTAR